MTFNVAQRILYDIRDNNSYTVRKLADGNCWMTTNLKLYLEPNKTYPDYGSYNNGTTFDLSTGTACGRNGQCIMNNNTVMTEHYAEGGYYYSWFAAVAGKGDNSTAGDVDGSICPKGWKLPYSYNYEHNKSYGSITSAYLNVVTNVNVTYSSTLNAFPISLQILGGYLDDMFAFYPGYTGNAYGGGSYGTYWSSTANGTDSVYYLNYGPNRTHIMWLDHKYYGIPMRCVAL